MPCEKWESQVGTEQNIENMSWNVMETLGTTGQEFIKKIIVTGGPIKAMNLVLVHTVAPLIKWLLSTAMF